MVQFGKSHSYVIFFTTKSRFNETIGNCLIKLNISVASSIDVACIL
jgi:hypothetical protein